MFFCLLGKFTGLVTVYGWRGCKTRLVIPVHSWWLGKTGILKTTHIFWLKSICRRKRCGSGIKGMLGNRGCVKVVGIRLLDGCAKDIIIACWILIWHPKCLLRGGKAIKYIIRGRLNWRLSPWLSSWLARLTYSS